MARFLLLLLLLLVRIDNVQAACYAGSWANGAPVYGALFVDGATTLAQCQALACQIYPGISESCPASCTPETQTQVQSCPSGYNGNITQTNTKVCPSNTWSGWVTTSSTCSPNPPTCLTTTDSKTETCGIHQSGQKAYIRTNTCSDPYGTQIQGQWLLTSNTCVQDPPTCQINTQTKT